MSAQTPLSNQGYTRWLILGLLLVTATYAIAEDVTLTTYYPSPRGVYAQLRIGVGTPAATTADLYVLKPIDDGNFAFRVDDAPNPDTTPFVIDQNGTVGIGTTAPGNKLQVAGAGGVSIDLRVNGRIQTGDAVNNGGLWLDGANTMFVGQNEPNVGFWTSGVGWGAFQIDKASGNVGIGTTVPGKKLDVQGGSLRVSGLLGTVNLDPDAGYPPGWGGGLHTWDVYAEGSVAAGPSGGPPAAVMNSAGDAAFTGSISATSFSCPSCVNSGTVQDGTIGSPDVDTTQVQQRVNGFCTGGQSIQSVNQDGTVVCVPSLSCIIRQANNAPGQDNVSVFCNPGEVATGGGCDAPGNVNQEFPLPSFGGAFPNGYHCRDSGETNIHVLVICCTL